MRPLLHTVVAVLVALIAFVAIIHMSYYGLHVLVGIAAVALLISGGVIGYHLPHLRTPRSP